MVEWLDFTKPHLLRNVAEYAAAIQEVDHLLDADPPAGSEAYERLEFLSVLVQTYEDTHCPLEELPTPQEVVDFMLEQKGLGRTDLAKWLGGKNRVAAFFHSVRPLSLRQIAALREHLGQPFQHGHLCARSLAVETWCPF